MTGSNLSFCFHCHLPITSKESPLLHWNLFNNNSRQMFPNHLPCFPIFLHQQNISRWERLVDNADEIDLDTSMVGNNQTSWCSFSLIFSLFFDFLFLFFWILFLVLLLYNPVLFVYKCFWSTRLGPIRPGRIATCSIASTCTGLDKIAMRWDRWNCKAYYVFVCLLVWTV